MGVAYTLRRCSPHVRSHQQHAGWYDALPRHACEGVAGGCHQDWTTMALDQPNHWLIRAGCGIRSSAPCTLIVLILPLTANSPRNYRSTAYTSSMRAAICLALVARCPVVINSVLHGVTHLVATQEVMCLTSSNVSLSCMPFFPSLPE